MKWYGGKCINTKNPDYTQKTLYGKTILWNDMVESVSP